MTTSSGPIGSPFLDTWCPPHTATSKRTLARLADSASGIGRRHQTGRELGAIPGPVHRGRLSDHAGDIVDELAKHLGVLLAVRTLLEMSGDALALGGRELATQIRNQVAVRMRRHVRTSPPSSSGSRARGADGRARSPRST